MTGDSDFVVSNDDDVITNREVNDDHDLNDDDSRIGEEKRS